MLGHVDKWVENQLSYIEEGLKHGVVKDHGYSLSI